MPSEAERLRRLSQVPVPVPPGLDEMLGYTGEARYVGFFWGPADDAYYTDGLRTVTAETSMYLLYVEHPLMRAALAACDVGVDAPERAARDYLVLDRSTGRLYVGVARVARELLVAQWPIPTPRDLAQAQLVSMTAADAEELLRRWRARVDAKLAGEASLSAEERGSRDRVLLARRRDREEALTRWLDEAQAAPERPSSSSTPEGSGGGAAS